MAKQGLSTLQCNPYGQSKGKNELGYSGCPSQCNGWGYMDNKVRGKGEVKSLTTVAAIQKHMMVHGPMATGMPVYDHFQSTPGIY